MGHQSDITKNRTSLKNWQKDEEKTYQGEFQETYNKIKGAAGPSGKYRSLSTFSCIIQMFQLWGRSARPKPKHTYSHPKPCGKIVDEAKVELTGHSTKSGSPEASPNKHQTHGEAWWGNIMPWSCFSSDGTGSLVKIDRIIGSSSWSPLLDSWRLKTKSQSSTITAQGTNPSQQFSPGSPLKINRVECEQYLHERTPGEK